MSASTTSISTLSSIIVNQPCRYIMCARLISRPSTNTNPPHRCACGSGKKFKKCCAEWIRPRTPKIVTCPVTNGGHRDGETSTTTTSSVAKGSATSSDVATTSIQNSAATSDTTSSVAGVDTTSEVNKS